MLYYCTKVKFLGRSEQRKPTNTVQVVAEGVRHSGSVNRFLAIIEWTWMKSFRWRSCASYSLHILLH